MTRALSDAALDAIAAILVEEGERLKGRAEEEGKRRRSAAPAVEESSFQSLALTADAVGRARQEGSSASPRAIRRTRRAAEAEAELASAARVQCLRRVRRTWLPDGPVGLADLTGREVLRLHHDRIGARLVRREARGVP
jgi:hypothetical protein